MKKYELTNETIEVDGRNLYRIKALRDFGYAKKGDLGGFIEGEFNLKQECDAWVSGDARVSEKKHYIVIQSIGSECGTFTAYKAKNGIECNRGCFSGTLEEFEEAVNDNHGDSKTGREYKIVIELVKMRLGEEK